MHHVALSPPFVGLTGAAGALQHDDNCGADQRRRVCLDWRGRPCAGEHHDQLRRPAGSCRRIVVVDRHLPGACGLHADCSDRERGRHASVRQRRDRDRAGRDHRSRSVECASGETERTGGITAPRPDRAPVFDRGGDPDNSRRHRRQHHARPDARSVFLGEQPPDYPDLAERGAGLSAGACGDAGRQRDGHVVRTEPAETAVRPRIGSDSGRCFPRRRRCDGCPA